MSRDGTPEAIEAFYHSTAWKKCKLAYKSLRNYTCERCGRPGWIVHHKTPLTIENVNDPSISLDFSNLELVCLSCHDAEHRRTSGGRLCIGTGRRLRTDAGTGAAGRRFHHINAGDFYFDYPRRGFHRCEHGIRYRRAVCKRRGTPDAAIHPEQGTQRAHGSVHRFVYRPCFRNRSVWSDGSRAEGLRIPRLRVSDHSISSICDPCNLHKNERYLNLYILKYLKINTSNIESLPYSARMRQ